MALAFLVNLLTARYLGPSNYGLVNYAALYTAFFTSFATLGLSSLLLKDFMDDPEGAGTTVGTAIAMRLLSSTLSAVSILAIVAAVDRGERLTMTVVALYSMSLIFQAFDTIQYWFQSRLESKYATIATSVGYIIVSFYKVLLLVLGKDVRWFAISNTIDYAVAAIVFLGLYKWRGGPRLHISPAKGRALLRQSGSFIICWMRPPLATTPRLPVWLPCGPSSCRLSLIRLRPVSCRPIGRIERSSSGITGSCMPLFSIFLLPSPP